jgi:hypothetical protein
MTSNQGSDKNGFAVDARSVQISAVLFGVGSAVCLAGAAIGAYALYDAVSRWIDELEQPPSAYAMNTWTQAKAATAAGVRAWLEQQEQQQQQTQLPQQRRKQPTTLRA